jgi:hypothetical protein
MCVIYYEVGWWEVGKMMMITDMKQTNLPLLLTSLEAREHHSSFTRGETKPSKEEEEYDR